MNFFEPIIGRITQLTENGFREDKKKLFSFEPVKTAAQRDAEWVAAVDETLKDYMDDPYLSEGGKSAVGQFVTELKTRMEVAV